ncbi:WD repeat-containing protein WRAP73-like [Hetaerina americana]|uniref:WD repeat-containing protein WRAP73-like n=1 Tax=Hetaerina americana TaxID=62018 RepID=UPI003A7F1CEA
MCASYSPRAFVQVFSLQNPSFRCKITEGTPGLVMALWSPDSRHILTVGILHVQLSIWSLANESVQYVHYLKKGSPGLEFSPDGEYLALLEQRANKEYVLILNSCTWAPVLRFECCDIWDVAGLAWCPDGSGLCTWSAPPSEGLQVHWLSGQTSQQVLSPEREVPETLGVRCVAWSPTSQFLAFGANDSQVHLINTITWHPIAKFPHQHHITTQRCTVYEEPLTLTKSSRTEYAVIESRPTRVAPVVEPRPALGLRFAAVPMQQGTKRLTFCPSGAWIASQDDSCPCVLWIWAIPTLQLHSVLVQRQAITDAQWSPTGDATLVTCTSSRHVSFWSPRGGALLLPSHLSDVSQVAWHPKGTCLLLKGAGEGSLHMFS